MKFILFLSLIGCSSALLGGLFDKILPKKDPCPIKLYNPQDSSFTGLKLYANADTFHPLLQTISTYAKDCRVKIYIKQSYIQETPVMTDTKLFDYGAISFRLGEAIEFELVDPTNKPLCNRLCLEKDVSKLSNLPDVKCFLDKLSKNSNIRQDAFKPTILMKQRKSNETLVTLQPQRQILQDKCKNFKMN